MLLQELYEHYGNWAKMCRQLDFGSNVYQSWRKNGGIPYKTQLLIEKKTNGKFLADEGHIRQN